MLSRSPQSHLHRAAIQQGRPEATRVRSETIPRWFTGEEDIMIHHLSIAARDPKHSAEVLAEIMGGKAVPFPPNPGSFFALQLDDHGSGVEVYPAGTELAPNGEVGGTFVKR